MPVNLKINLKNLKFIMFPQQAKNSYRVYKIYWKKFNAKGKLIFSNEKKFIQDIYLIYLQLGK